MFLKIIACAIGIIAAIPILLWFAIRGIFTGSWKLLGFVCQHQYRELKRLCEHGTAAELQTFLDTQPSAKEYVIYTRRDRPTSILTRLFRLPAPLAVAGHANNLAVIPVLLANGASPETRSVSAVQTPAEEAFGEPDKMRALCGGRTWWMERTESNAALDTANPRRIIWQVMRGARLTGYEQLCTVDFLRLPTIMQEFICHFGINEESRKEMFSKLKQIGSEEQKQITVHRFHSPFGYRNASLKKEFDEMTRILEKSMNPLPAADDDASDRLMFSAGLMDRTKMLELLDNLFTTEQQFALLDRLAGKPLSEGNCDMTEEVVDLLLSSILKKAGDTV